GRLGFWFGDPLQDHFEGNERTLNVERLERARMQFAEMTQNILRADLNGAAAAGVKPRRSARHHLQRLWRRAGRYQRRQYIGLGVERIDLAVFRAPMAADAG